MTSERLFNSFIHPQKLLYPQKQISGYAPAPDGIDVDIEVLSYISAAHTYVGHEGLAF